LESGPDPERRSYFWRATFEDPDGNEWLMQEITARLPGRIDATTTSYTSTSDLADAMRHASVAHGEHENRIGEADANWPDWYAAWSMTYSSRGDPDERATVSELPDRVRIVTICGNARIAANALREGRAGLHRVSNDRRRSARSSVRSSLEHER
jgi:hypothetical protein